MWRSKLLLALIIYFAGFATAVYYLAPASDRPNSGESRAGGFGFGGRASQFKSEEFAEVAGANVRKLVSFAEEKAVELGKLIRTKLAEQSEK